MIESHRVRRQNEVNMRVAPWALLNGRAASTSGLQTRAAFHTNQSWGQLRAQRTSKGGRSPFPSAADLSEQKPTEFKLAAHLKTVEALVPMIGAALVARADKIIE